jgi:membrane associated rhomboid family serine protease
MNFDFSAYWNSVTRTVRVLILVFLVVWLADASLEYLFKFHLKDSIALMPKHFWRGEFWRLFTHPFLPRNFSDLLATGIVLVFLGSRLESLWSRLEFLAFCFLCFITTALADVLLAPTSLTPFCGFSGATAGIFVAWLLLFGDETVSIFGISAKARAFAIVGFSYFVFTSIFRSGQFPLESLLPLVGGFTAGIYLFLRSRRTRATASDIKTSQRIARLEL